MKQSELSARAALVPNRGRIGENSVSNFSCGQDSFSYAQYFVELTENGKLQFPQHFRRFCTQRCHMARKKLGGWQSFVVN
jgi:hypothetical protein